MTPKEKELELINKYYNLFNMTPKEKAKDLVDKFNYEGKHYLMLDAKQCALISVDEILNSKHGWNKYTSTFVKYWQEVKQEIEKL